VCSNRDPLGGQLGPEAGMDAGHHEITRHDGERREHLLDKGLAGCSLFRSLCARHAMEQFRGSDGSQRDRFALVGGDDCS
jgi:hypothetical protein